MTSVVRAFRKGLILAPLLLFGTALLIVILALRRRRRGMSTRSAWTTSARDGLVILTVAGPLAVTLVPAGGPGGRSLDLIPMRSAWHELTNSVDARAAVLQLGGNVLLLLPFGLLAPIRWPALDGFWRVLAAATLLGVVIETLQFTFGVGRVASASDMLLYAVGGVVGYVLLRASRRFSVPPRQESMRRGKGASLV